MTDKNYATKIFFDQLSVGDVAPISTWYRNLDWLEEMFKNMSSQEWEPWKDMGRFGSFCLTEKTGNCFRMGFDWNAEITVETIGTSPIPTFLVKIRPTVEEFKLDYFIGIMETGRTMAKTSNWSVEWRTFAPWEFEIQILRFLLYINNPENIW